MEKTKAKAKTEKKDVFDGWQMKDRRYI